MKQTLLKQHESVVAERDLLLKEVLDSRRTIDGLRTEFSKARAELEKDKDNLWKKVNDVSTHLRHGFSSY